jgi:SRSO17 transposase
MALAQVDRAVAAGVRFSWITADEWYAQKPRFVAGLEQRALRFVLEIPRNFPLWLHDPAAGVGAPAKPVENLCRFSRVLMQQPWQRYYVKDTDKGPLVWEIKFAPCWLPRGHGVVGPYWLVVARNALHPEETKYFISNAAAGVPLPVILHVAFGRWPVERCLEDEKSELGLSHFEVRCYPALKRHLLITQISHLFLARQANRLRGEKSRGHRAAGSHGDQRLDRCAVLAASRASRTALACRQPIGLLANAEHAGSQESHQNPAAPTRKHPHHRRATAPLPPQAMSDGAL